MRIRAGLIALCVVAGAGACGPERQGLVTHDDKAVGGGSNAGSAVVEDRTPAALNRLTLQVIGMT